MREKDLRKLRRILEHIKKQISQKKRDLKRLETYSGSSHRADMTEEFKVACEEHRDMILKEFPELKKQKNIRAHYSG